MKKKGFTLIELLAVILILAIIAVIVTPIISKIIEQAKTQADKRSAEKYAKAAQTFYVQSQVDEYKRSFLGSNIIDKLELENTDATGTVVAYSDGTTEMAIKIGSKCFTKTTTQDIKDIQVSSDIENCVVKSSNVRISNINSGESSIVITIDNSSDSSISITSCKYGTSRGDLTLDGTISGTVCTLSPTVVGERYYYELTLSDGSKTSGDVQGGTGDATPQYEGGNSNYTNPGGGDHGGGAGNGGTNNPGVAAPVFEGENGQVYYTGTYLSRAQMKYFDVTTGEKCSLSAWQDNGGSTANSKNTGCLRFFAYMEDNLSYTMILDRNIDHNGYAWASSGSTTAGPSTAKAKLKELTDSWQGTITPKNYVFVKGATPYEIAYDTDEYKARFITTDEIKHITQNSSFDVNSATNANWFYLDGYALKDTDSSWHTQVATSETKSVFYWLFDYLYQAPSYGAYTAHPTTISANHNGGGTSYWTSDAVSSNTSDVWIVSGNGALNSRVGGMNGGLYYNDTSVWYNAGASGTYYVGIRPVITVLKSKLN